MKKYYNYVYLDPRKPGKYYYAEIPISFLFEPFYVGKGIRYRLYDHLRCVHSHERSLKSNKIKKIVKEGFDLKSFVLKFNENITENSALSKENLMITVIGRISLKTGPLTNLTDGGEIGSWSWFNKTEAQRERTSKRMTEDNPSCRPEVRAKLSAAKMGKIPSNLNFIHNDPGVKEKRSKSLKGMKMPQHAIDKGTISKKNSVWMNDGSMTRMIQKEFIDGYLAEGWKMGRTFHQRQNKGRVYRHSLNSASLTFFPSR